VSAATPLLDRRLELTLYPPAKESNASHSNRTCWESASIDFPAHRVDCSSYLGREDTEDGAIFRGAPGGLG